MGRGPERAAYGDFAPYYDVVYRNLVDYAGDVAFLDDVFREHALRPVHRVLDLGCGTGTHALLLAERGIEVDGVDVSPGLLALARGKAAKAGAAGARVRFHEADMTKRLPDGPFDAAVSMFGAFNYVTEDEATDRLLEMIAERVPTGGLFVFEFWNPIGVEPGRRWDRSETADGGAVVRLFDSSYDMDASVVALAMDVIVTRGREVVASFREEHRLRARTPAEVKRLVERHGFDVAAFTGGEREGKTRERPSHDAFRVMAVARRR